MTPRPRRKRCRPGLTLVEVLVALVLTSMVVIGTWRFFASASEAMSVFTGVSIVDERMALAADLLASDARRAGMFATPYSGADPYLCVAPASALRAVVVQDGASLPGFSFGNNVHVDPDACIFLEPVSDTLLNPVQITGANIQLSAADVPATADEFDALFTDRTLRITAPLNGFYEFVDVTAVNFETLTVTVSPTPTRREDHGWCGIEDTGGPGHEIHVLTRVRYQIIPDPDEPTEETLLVREELDPTLTRVLPGTRLVVAENIVDLQCWGDRDAGGGLAGPDFAPDPQLGDDDGTADLSATSTETQRLRVLHFSLAGRTDNEFSSYTHRPKLGPFDLLSTWDVDGDPSNAALTLGVGQQVEVSSLVVRGYQ